MPIILVIVPGTQATIKNINQICDMEVHFEHQRKKKRTGQCFNCQKFEHSAYNCKAEPVCRHCAGNHESRAHNKDDVGPNKCNNCEGPHKSNFRGCPAFPSMRKKDGNKEPPPPPRRARTPSNLGNNNTPRIPESSDLNELIIAMDEFKDLIIRRPILASLIQLKHSQGAITSPSSD
ncbi:hypothetical protein JTB14_006705 [Gonioctena quinquepunctata]|nr:hypothetical protein JTB14_006705 [Gonioctena quinquepunctata]